MSYRTSASLAALGSILAAAPLAAQSASTEPGAGSAAVTPADPPAPPTGQRYVPADFSRFAPRTALDMVRLVPGFAISSAGGGGRGLGNARENVLINGERIADKNTDAQTFLSRINADAVRYIEIVDGASLNVPGLAGQVANVVLVESASRGFKTTVRWSPEVRPRVADNWFAGEISTSGSLGGNAITISLSNEAIRRGFWGPERVLDANGNLRFVRDEIFRVREDAPRLALTLTRTAANGNKLNLALGGAIDNSRVSTVGTSLQPGVGRVDELFHDRENERNANIGGDYEFALGQGRLKLIGQHRYEHSPSVSSFTLSRAGGVPSGSRFTQTADESESILRGEYRWRTGGGTDWQVTLEGAYNLLDVAAELALLQPDGNYRPVAFGGERTRVDEKRAEIGVNWSRTLAANLTAQLNLGAEYSQLASTGPGGLTRSFVRPKGRLALAWKVAPKTTINMVLQRRVDQLDFFDFASFVDVANDVGTTGNGSLVPPILNRSELELVQDAGAWGNASITMAYARAENLVDQIPLSATTEGRGNLPTAHLYRLSGRATLLLDPLGLKGVRINGDVTLRRNRVRDPLTGQWRDQSRGQQHRVDVGLRHDVAGTDLAWGANLLDERFSPNLRLDEISDGFRTRPFVSAFVEHKDVGGFTLRAEVRNIANMKDALDRTVFVNRRDGPVAFSESRRRGFGHFFVLTVTGTL